MGEVKRWKHHVTWDGDLNIQATMMALRSDGEYVLATDYATLEAENAKLRAELERRADDTREARVVGFKPGMGHVTLEVGRLPAWLDMGMTCYVAAAPSAPATVQGVNQQLIKALEAVLNSGRGTSGRIILDAQDEADVRAAIAAARQEVK